MLILFWFYEHSLDMYTAHSEHVSQLGFLPTHGPLACSHMHWLNDKYWSRKADGGEEPEESGELVSGSSQKHSAV